jgi:hypothetical protein
MAEQHVGSAGPVSFLNHGSGRLDESPPIPSHRLPARGVEHSVAIAGCDVERVEQIGQRQGLLMARQRFVHVR